MATTLDRILQSQGFGTRRYCGDLVAAGLVEVNGELCEDPGARFEVDGLRLMVDGEEWLACTKAYVMLNKPTGYECSQRPRHHPVCTTCCRCRCASGRSRLWGGSITTPPDCCC
jgi:16S rRNA pseudouridine516 synthase